MYVSSIGAIILTTFNTTFHERILKMQIMFYWMLFIWGRSYICCSAWLEVRGKLEGIFLCFFCGSRRSNSGHQVIRSLVVKYLSVCLFCGWMWYHMPLILGPERQREADIWVQASQGCIVRLYLKKAKQTKRFVILIMGISMGLYISVISRNACGGQKHQILWSFYYKQLWAVWCRCWQLNLGLFEEQFVLFLMAESSLWPSCIFLIVGTKLSNYSVNFFNLHTII